MKQSVLGSYQIWPLLASKGKANGWPTHEGQGTPSQRGNVVRLEGLVEDQVGEGHSDWPTAVVQVVANHLKRSQAPQLCPL